MNFLSDEEIREKVRTLVLEARDKFGIDDGVRGRDACELIGLSLSSDLIGNRDGLIDGNRIVVNEAIRNAERVEFTIFHEVTHYLLDEDGELIDYFTSHLRRNKAEYDRAIERIANIGAAEFLMPRERIRSLIDEQGYSIDIVQALASQSGSSILAASIQAAVYAPLDCHVIVCNYGPGRAPSELTPTLRVDQATERPGMKYPLARYLPIPTDHFFWEAYRSQQALKDDRTYVPFRNAPKNVRRNYGEAVSIGGRVVGIIYWNGRPAAKTGNQMTLF